MKTWPQDALDQLSLRDKLAQLVFVRLGSNMVPPRTAEEDYDRAANLLQEYALGGVVLFNGQREETPLTLKALQEVARYPLLVGADIERGLGEQMRGYQQFPHAQAFAASEEEAALLVREFGRLTALAARSVGIHIAFAPVADVNIDPQNPIIATRAFGSDPLRVAELVTAYVAGCREGGLLTTAKHFPGHGNTRDDSHHALPRVAASRAELEACEFVPFRAAIAAGVPILMSAHVQYPALDPSDAPATLSAPILRQLLREKLGFQGLVVSDSLQMAGVTRQCPDEGELAVQAILAGVDALLDVSEPTQVFVALEQAVSDERLPLARVNEALKRIASLKESMFNGRPHVSTEISLVQVIADSLQLASRVARNAVRVCGSPGPTIQLSEDRGLMVVMLRPHQSHRDPPEQPLGRLIRSRHPRCEYCELGPLTTPTEYEQVRQRAETADQLVLAMVVKPAAWQAFGLRPEQDVLVQSLTHSRDCLLVSLGSPNVLGRYPEAAGAVCTYSDVEVSQSALVDFLMGDRNR
jgi:beta-glucosidase-like glycosyl hydrolase